MAAEKNLVVCPKSLTITLCYFASVVEVTNGPTKVSYEFLKDLYLEYYEEVFLEDQIEKISLKEVSSKMLYDMLDAWEASIDWEKLYHEDRRVWNNMSRCASQIKEAAQGVEEAELITRPDENGIDVPVHVGAKMLEEFMNGPWIKSLIVKRPGIGKRGQPSSQETLGVYNKKRNEAHAILDEEKPFNYSSRSIAIAMWFAEEIQNYSEYLKGIASGKASESELDEPGMDFLNDLLSGRPTNKSGSTERDWAEGNMCSVTFTGINLPGIALRVDPLPFSNKEIQYMAAQVRALKQMASEAEGICATPDSIKYGKNIEIELNTHHTSLISSSKAFEDYDLSLLNIDRPAEDLVNQLKGVLAKPESERPDVISALFYGVPGSGKSKLANYIGKQLGLPVMKKTYAELQSMYVGEGEKQLSQAFKEAQSQGAILLIDELDSIAGNRSKADKNYQKTFVNQLLNELDNYQGIFIATCNFEDSLDPAVLRRLFLKIKFDFMNQEQTENCFKLYFPKFKRSKIGEISYLTPGDFHTVREASRYETGKLTIKRIKEMLTQEVTLKKKTLNEVIKSETKAGYDM
jgi:DNA replication protein DnaC